MLHSSDLKMSSINWSEDELLSWKDRIVLLLVLTVPYLFAIACKSCLAIVWLEWDIRLIGQSEVQISLHWTSIYGVQSNREFTDKALLPVFESCGIRGGIASLMPSTRLDAPAEVRRAVRHMETRVQRCINLQGGHVDGRAGLQWVLSYNMICSTKPNGTFQSQQSPNDPFQGHQKRKEKRKTLSHALYYETHDPNVR